MPSRVKKVALRTFYIVFSYIFLFSLWWGYLLYQKNETAYQERVEIMLLNSKEGNNAIPLSSMTEYVKLTNKYNRQKLMIFLEGGVYLILLLFGFLRVRKIFLTEMELAEQQKNFLLSVTHELKSPLSTVKLSLQTLQKHQLPEEKRTKLIDNSLTDLARLQDLVDNILFAAKIERDEHGMQSEEIDASLITEKTIERYLQNKKQIRILRNIQPNVHIHADAVGYTSIVVNLLENAIKYSEEKTEIDIELQAVGSQFLLTIKDQGIGIPEEDREKVFDKFYRVGSENTRKTKGTGLGLYIVKRFVEIHGGSIMIGSNNSKGTVIQVIIPIKA